MSPRINKPRNPNIKITIVIPVFFLQFCKLFLIALEKCKLCSPIFYVQYIEELIIEVLEILKFQG